MWAFDLVQSTAMLKLSLYLFVVWFCICLFFGFVFVLYFLAGCALVLSAAVVLVSLASWRRRRGLTFAADPQIRANWVNPSLRQPTQEKLATIIFRQKLPLSCFGFTMLLPGVNTFY